MTTIKLRELEPTDADHLLRLLNDRQVSSLLNIDSKLKQSDIENFIIGGILLAGDLRQAITDDHKHLLGLIRLNSVDSDSTRAVLSIALFPEYQRRGWGTQAVFLMLNKGFSLLPLREIWFATRSGNVAMKALGKKCGFYPAEPPSAFYQPEPGLLWYRLERSQVP